MLKNLVQITKIKPELVIDWNDIDKK